MGEALRIASVRKAYGKVPVIADLSLEIAAGEFVVFLGPSGCGKSTLLRLIAGLEMLDSGEIHLGGRRIDNLPPGDREVAMVFQHYALYPNMSVRDNMAFGLRNASVAESIIAERVTSAAASLELESLLDRRPGQLSGGQKQRVAIARAIVKQPKLFLFDEPLSNLDAALRGRTRLEIAQLHNRLDTTMIFVTHDQVEAMTLADTIVVLNAGHIEQCGSPMEIYRQPRTRFVAEFVGAPKINVLRGELHRDTGRVAFCLPGGTLVAINLGAEALPDTTFELGIRAEKILVGPPGKGHLDAKVVLVERLGDRTLVHARLSDGQIIIGEDRADLDLSPGSAIGMHLDEHGAMLFDAHGTAYHCDTGQ